MRARACGSRSILARSPAPSEARAAPASLARALEVLAPAPNSVRGSSGLVVHDAVAARGERRGARVSAAGRARSREVLVPAVVFEVAEAALVVDARERRGRRRRRGSNRRRARRAPFHAPPLPPAASSAAAPSRAGHALGRPRRSVLRAKARARARASSQSRAERVATRARARAPGTLRGAGWTDRSSDRAPRRRAVAVGARDDSRARRRSRRAPRVGGVRRALVARMSIMWLAPRGDARANSLKLTRPARPRALAAPRAGPVKAARRPAFSRRSSSYGSRTVPPVASMRAAAARL